MTVSPNSAQDGILPQYAGDKGVHMDSNHQQAALPPTLFSLPNLRGDAKRASDLDRRQQPPIPPAVSVEIQTPATAAPEMRMAQEEIQHIPQPPTAEVANPVPAPAARSESQPRSEGQTRFSGSQSSDLPVGRTWMETIRSHGVVVVLLLVVVAAALITSTGSGDKDSEDSLVESQDLLNIDSGTEVTLPLPIHSHAESTAAIPEHDGNAAAQPSDVEASVNPPLSHNDLMASLEAPQQTELSTAGSETEIAANESAENKPAASQSPTGPALPAETSVEALPASTRMTGELNPPELPSMADLSEPAANKAGLEPAGAPQAVRQTTTPIGISDLLKYLPPDPAGASATADTPSTSQ
jgi:hypothetical protein